MRQYSEQYRLIRQYTPHVVATAPMVVQARQQRCAHHYRHVFEEGGPHPSKWFVCCRITPVLAGSLEELQAWRCARVARQVGRSRHVACRGQGLARGWPLGTRGGLVVPGCV